MRPFFAVLVLVLVACARHDERTGTTRQAVVGQYATTASVNSFNPAFFPFVPEPVGAFANSRILIGGLNVAGIGGVGWFVATVAGGNITIIKACAMNGSLGCPPVTPPPPAMSWGSDPTVVADGKGNVVMVSLADTNGVSEGPRGDEAVVAAVSSDLGQSFGGAVIVNTIGSTNCNVEIHDQPHAVFDYSTSPPTLVVGWRARANSLTSTYGACVRRGVVDTTVMPATLRWLDTAKQVGGIQTGTFVGIGGIRIAAGDGVTTLAFFGTADLRNCPEAGNADVYWRSVSTFDNGETWTFNQNIFVSQQYRWCVLTPPTLDTGGRDFDMVRAPGGAEYVAIHDSKSTIRLFMSPAGGSRTQASAPGPPANTTTWYEYCPGTPTSNKLGGPVTSWKNVDSGPCTTAAFRVSPGRSLLFPTLAVDGRGQLAVTYYESNPLNVPTMGTAEDTLLRVMFQGSINPQDSRVSFQPFPIVSSPQWFSPPPGARGLGDYMGIAVKPATNLSPKAGCTEKNDFLPLWVQGICTRPPCAPTDNADVFVTGVVLGP